MRVRTPSPTRKSLARLLKGDELRVERSASHLPTANRLTFWFPFFGSFFVMALKGEPFISGFFERVRLVQLEDPVPCEAGGSARILSEPKEEQFS